MLIPITQYAALHGRTPATIRQRILRGCSATAIKVGRDWFIDDAEPLEDSRVRNGNYIGWRKQKEVD